MNKAAPRSRRYWLPLGIVGFWTIVALVAGIQNFVSLRTTGDSVSFVRAVTWHLPILTVWALATPLVLQSARRWPLVGSAWKRHLTFHALVGVIFVCVINAAWPVLYPSEFHGLTRHIWLSRTAQNLMAWLPLALIVYFAIVLAGHLVYRPHARNPEWSGDGRSHEQDRTSYAEQMTIRGLNRSFVVPTRDIDWIEASGDHVIYHIGERKLKERRRLKDVQRSLDPGQFVRVHRSTIAQVAHIREMHALEHGDFIIVMDSGARVRLTRSRRKALESALGRPI